MPAARTTGRRPSLGTAAFLFGAGSVPTSKARGGGDGELSQPPLEPAPCDETAERPNRHRSHRDLTVGGKWSFRKRRNQRNPGVCTGFPPELWKVLRLEVQAINSALEAEIASWKRRVSDRESKLSKRAQNSSRPPGSVHPHSREKPRSQRAAGRSRGGPAGDIASRSGGWFRVSNVRRSSRCIRPCAGKECGAKAGIWTAVTATFTRFVVRRSRWLDPRRRGGQGIAGRRILGRRDHRSPRGRQLLPPATALLGAPAAGLSGADRRGWRRGANWSATAGHRQKVFRHWPRARDGTVTRRTMKAHLLDLAGDLLEVFEAGLTAPPVRPVTLCGSLLDRYDPNGPCVSHDGVGRPTTPPHGHCVTPSTEEGCVSGRRAQAAAASLRCTSRRSRHVASRIGPYWSSSPRQSKPDSRTNRTPRSSLARNNTPATGGV